MVANTKINMGNDEFILYIRKKMTICSISNDDLGKQIWLWLEKKGAVKTFEGKPQACLWGKDASNRDKDMLPYTATQFSFDRNLLPVLYAHLDDLAQQ